MSRPKKPEGTRLTTTAVSLPPRTKAQLDALTYQTGLTMQEHIRRALDAYFYGLQQQGRFDPDARRPVGIKRPGRPTNAELAARRQQQAEPPPRRMFRRPGMSASA